MPTAEIEGLGQVDFPEDATQQEMVEWANKNAPKQPTQKTSAAGAAGRGFLTGLLPTAAAVGTELLLAPESLGASLLAIPPTIAAGWGAAKLQQKVLEKAAPEFTKLQQADIDQHPISTRVGGLAAGAPFLRVQPGTIFSAPTKAVVPAAMGATIGAVQPLLEGHAPTAGDVAEGAAFGLIYGPNRFRKPQLSLAAAAAAKAKGEADARSQQKTTEVHGDVPPQPGEGAGQVPAEESSAGVQSQQPITPQEKPPATEQPRVLLRSPVAQQLQQSIGTISAEEDAGAHSRRIADAVKGKVITPAEASGLRRQLAAQRKNVQLPVLTPEEQGFIDAERKAIDTPVEVVESATGEGDPFARKPRAGQIAGINRQKGTVEIYPEEFSGWLAEDVPADKRQLAVRSLLAEERNHLATTSDQADSYWDSLTAAEKAIETRIYTERWRGRPDVSNTDLGFEAIRRRMQRLARMDTTETVRTAGVERWGLKSLEALNDAIRATRETLSTKASKEGLAILDKVQENLNAGIVAAGGRPAALRPSPTADDLLKMKPEDVGGYLKQVKYSPEDAARWAAKMTPEDIQRLSQESQNLRDQTTKALSETAKMEAGPGRDAKMNEALRTSLKAQTLREVVEDYGKEPQPAALRPVKKSFEEWRDQYQRTANELSSLREQLRNYPDFNRVTQQRLPSREVDEVPADVRKMYRLTQFLHELQSMPEYEAFEKSVGVGAFGRGEGTPRIGPGVEPAAFRPKKKGEQQEFLLPPETVTGKSSPHGTIVPKLQEAPKAERPAQLPQVPPQGAEAIPEGPSLSQAGLPLRPMSGIGGERPSAAELGAKPFTATDLDRAGYTHLEQATEQALSKNEAGKAPKPPSFRDYKTALQHQFGDLQPGQLYESYSNNLYKRLFNASGPHLEAIAKSIGIRARSVPEPTRAERLALETEGATPAVKSQMRAERAAAGSRERYRTQLISRIAEKLLKDAAPEVKPSRTSVSPEDLRYAEGSQEPAYFDVTSDDLAHPDVLAQRLTQDARRSGKDPVSLTKRLTALLDKQTGKVSLVSTYPHGRSGAILLDPSVTGLRTHRPLAEILRRFRPVSSMLLDEPVQNFRQNYASLGEFESSFATDARRAAQQSFPEPLPEGAEQPVGSREVGAPLTDAEAGSLLDSLYDEVSKIESPEDTRLLVDGLHARYEAGQLTGRDWTAIGALEKVYNALKRKWPELTETQIKDQTLDEIYEVAKKSKDREAFQAEALSRYAPKDVGAISSAAPEERPSGTSRELTLPVERRPPTDIRPENIPADVAARMAAEKRPAPPVPTGTVEPSRSGPAAFRPIKDIADEVRAAGEGFRTIITRGGVINDVARVLDSAETSANNFARQEETRVRLPSVQKPAGRLADRFTQWQRGDKQVLAAANAVVESQFSKALIPIFKNKVANGLARTQRMQQSNSWRDRRIGAAWERSAKELMAELDYADAHWNDPELQSTARRVKAALDDQYNREKAAGYDLTKDPNYLPHRYDATLWNGNSVLFQEMRLWGKKWREPKTFDSHYAAIAEGPYIPVTRDSASLVGHRVRQGTTAILGREWHAALKAINLPSGTPLAIDPKQGTHARWISPNPNYDIVELGGGQKPLAVQTDYSKAMRSVLNPHSVIEEWGPSRSALHLSQMLKHSLLIGDFFHLARMGYYGTSILGKNFGWKSGWSVLDIAPRDMNQAVQRGIITPKDVAWANEPVRFGTTTITRRALVEKFYRESGSNLGRIQDALYKDLITDLTPTAGPLRRGLARLADPTTGQYNRFLFDRLTRGLMAESVAREFERQSKAKPGADPNILMRDISRDVNNFYGNIGRQGWFKAKWQQDVARLLFLAPQWVEGLIKKEAVAYSRLSGASSLTGQRQGVTAMGTTGRSVGRAMVFMLGLTQAINLITRGKPSWQNDEDGHKLDAWIPAWGSGKEGFWMSPLAIFNEITHDLYRIGEAKVQDGKPVLDAVTQIAGNKESPITRALIVMGSGKTPSGQIITSSAGRVGEAAKAMAPLPITFGRYAQAAGHAVAPGAIPAVQPGAMQRQAAGTMGVKIEPAKGTAGEIRSLAQQFMRKEGLQKESGWQQVQTDEPSYSKLRSAIRANDDAHALKILNELRKGRTDAMIVKAMKKHSVAPFTGSTKAERLFLSSLDDRGLERYSAARDQLMGDFERFADFMIQQPERQD